MGSSAKFQYSALAPLAAETFQVQDAELVWSRTWLAPQQKAAVETVQTAPLEEATQQVGRTSSQGSDAVNLLCQ